MSPSSFSTAQLAVQRPPNSTAARGGEPAWPRATNHAPADNSGPPANFAHDLNNFITIINGYSEVCLAHVGDKDETLRKYLRAIHEATQRAGDLTLKLIALNQQKKKSSLANGFPHGSESILVVEDEKALRELLRSVLEQHGYRVTFASDGETAAKFFSASPQTFDVVLLDLQLPDISGFSVLERIKQLRPEQKFIAVSGCASAETDAALKRLGVQDHLLKPYHLGDLGRTLRSVVTRAA